MIKNYKLILDGKNCYQVCHKIIIILKILKIVTNLIELGVKVDKSICKRLLNRTKLIKIKHALFRGP